MVEAMNAYWAEHPPLHVMVAAYLGVGGKSTSKKVDEQFEFTPTALPAEDFNAVLQQFGLPTTPAP